jgi:hypothetical protein
MYKFINRKNIGITSVFLWAALGFKRGNNFYDYNHKKNNDNVMNKQNSLYSTKMFYGIVGSLIYINPLFIFCTIPKEIYRLEVNLRNLEDDKKSNYYNEIL